MAGADVGDCVLHAVDFRESIDGGGELLVEFGDGAGGQFLSQRKQRFRAFVAQGGADAAEMSRDCLREFMEDRVLCDLGGEFGGGLRLKLFGKFGNLQLVDGPLAVYAFVAISDGKGLSGFDAGLRGFNGFPFCGSELDVFGG